MIILVYVLFLCQNRHPNRSPHPTTDTAGSRVDPSGTSNRVDTSGNSRLDPSGTARVDMTGASKADTPRSSRFDPSGTSRFDTSRLDVPSGRPKRVEETIINPVIRNRKSDTEVREIVNPAITKETVIEENREQKVTAVDRELHQDHYQTRVQPVIDKKVLPEEHVHRTVPVEYREHKHNKREEIRRALEEEVSVLFFFEGSICTYLIMPHSVLDFNRHERFCPRNISSSRARLLLVNIITTMCTRLCNLSLSGRLSSPL